MYFKYWLNQSPVSFLEDIGYINISKFCEAILQFEINFNPYCMQVQQYNNSP